MPWIRRLLRGKEVYARCTENGALAPDRDGRVEIIYKLAPDAKVYRANPRNLTEPEGGPDVPIELELAGADEAPAPLGGDAVIIYTDGACTGNPGPMGLGAVILDRGERIEISEYLGHGTNNVAELTAILRAIERLTDEQRQRPVVIHSDSSYAIGLLTKNWKAKANQELVAEVRDAVASVRNVRFVKVKGHAGVPENERCDELARAAIEGA